jgi:hypothetical protein
MRCSSTRNGLRPEEAEELRPGRPRRCPQGDWWDDVAYDPEHRLVLAVVPGARSIENAEAVVAAAKGRTGGAAPG